jgi:U3 small nucleolar RNA-associated protein 12
VGIARANSKKIDVYFIRNVAETLRKRSRRLRRRREKESKQDRSIVEAGNSVGRGKPSGRKRGILDDDDDENNINGMEGKEEHENQTLLQSLDPNEIKASDEFEYAATIIASHKVKAFTFAPYREKNGGVRIIAALATNALEVHSIQRTIIEKSELRKYTSSLVSTLDMYGHPTGIRSIAISLDDTLACTVSKNVTKVWNVANRSCIRSLPLASSSVNKSEREPSSFYGLCSTFLPGDSHLVIGTREGFLIIIDIASGEIVFTEKAHDGAVWSLDLKRPNPVNGEEIISIVTGSADNSVKFWDVESQDEDTEEGALRTSGHPMLVHVRTLQTTDDVVAVRYSHSTRCRALLRLRFLRHSTTTWIKRTIDGFTINNSE